ncbi:lasso peptide biosynthesis B2 protein [Nostoc spongiaeforme FACHB-130]|uniref:Lasso peptide biosynthesis B2 protein n=1 Tax=Nostoc spongiaeforme FACHB-130 TaxID=1357510 RepID=A0ABR8G0T7_9NOSO|nr:lasso peptide biosynthesis B2 protein [Nostoc spongiaeforme]MBD2596836.1 lasso peptide biosynthesis B2 protein [Nostoc spongiaeforme FACHB-130]
MKRLLKLLQLSNSDRQFLLRTFVLLGLVRLGMWLLSFNTLRKLINKISKPNFQLEPISLHKIVWAINVSTRYTPGGAKCLARALTCQVLMTRYGYKPELRIGVVKSEAGNLEAHAWIETQGYVVIGYLPDLSRFTPLPSLARI